MTDEKPDLEKQWSEFMKKKGTLSEEDADKESRRLIRESIREIKNYKSVRLARFALSLLTRSAVFSCSLYAALTRKNGESLDHLKRFFDVRRRRGLYEGSILQNPLYTSGQESYLEMHTASAGLWVAYDFRREKMYKNPARSLRKGTVFTLSLDEVAQNPWTLQTPDTLLNIFDISHILQFDKPTIGDVVETGLLRETTYAQAYASVGLYEQYAKSIEFFDLAGKPVYQVTPKGNTLIFIADHGGDKTPSQVPDKEWKEAFGSAF